MNKYDWRVSILKSEDEVFQVLAELRGKRWLCRGQSECYNCLLPTIDRNSLNKISRINKLTLERQSIDLFRSTAQYFSDKREQNSKFNDLIALMVLRHYNVPTRLLDWTLSPYVAAYFSVSSNDRKDGEIWSFDENLYAIEGRKQWSEFPDTTIDGSGDPDKFDYSLKTAFSVQEPNDWIVCQFYEGFPRQIAQEGAYSITSRFNRDHADKISQLLKKTDHYHKYIIKSNLKPALRKSLREKHGIWRGALFPDVAGAAETAYSIFNTGIEQLNQGEGSLIR